MKMGKTEGLHDENELDRKLQIQEVLCILCQRSILDLLFLTCLSLASNHLHLSFFFFFSIFFRTYITAHPSRKNFFFP